MKTFHSFNTGRLYTNDGQQIIYSAELQKGALYGYDSYKIIFADISRGINHVIPHCMDDSKQALMSHYDSTKNLDYAKHSDLETLQAHFEKEIKKYSQFDYGKKTGRLF